MVVGVERTQVPAGWLDAGGAWPICLVQARPPAAPSASVPENLELVRTLCSAPTGARTPLARWLPGGGTALVLLPEMALGPDDAGPLGAAMEAADRPSLLVTGAGLWSGQRAREWRDADPASRTFGFSDPGRLDPALRYNAGLVIWSDGAGTCRSWIFLKNFLEQQVQATWPGVHEGWDVLRLDAQDVTLFPLICADLVADGGASPRERIAASLHERPAARVLVTVSAWTGKPGHRLWAGHLDELARVSPGQVLIAVSNAATGRQGASAGLDRWRCLSGVYHDPSQPDRRQGVRPEVRAVVDGHTRGSVLRRVDAGVAAAPLRWVLGPTLGRDHWSPRSFHPVAPGGGLAAPAQDVAAHLETRNRLSRLPASVSGPAWTTRVVDPAREGLLADLPRDTPEAALALWDRVSGPRDASAEALAPAELCDGVGVDGDGEARLHRGLLAVAILKKATGRPLRPPPHGVPVLEAEGATGSGPIGVWTSSRLGGRQLQRAVEDGIHRGRHESMVLFAEGQSGAPSPKTLPEAERRSVDEAGVDRGADPPAWRGRQGWAVTEPRPLRVRWCPLGAIEDEVQDALDRGTDPFAAVARLVAAQSAELAR